MAPRRPFIPYRKGLKRRSQSLRRDPSPAERKLWFEFLRDLHEGARYDTARTATLELEGIRVLRITNLEVMEQFEGVCQRIHDTLARST